MIGAMTRARVANFTHDHWKTNLPNFQGLWLPRNLRLVEFLKAMGKRYDRTPGEVAIAWTLSHPVVTGAIVGFRNSKQVSGIAGALEFGPSQSEVAEIGKALQAEAAA